MTQQSFEEFKAAVREVLAQGHNVREQVRDITINALQDGRLDTERIRQVLSEAFEGVGAGLGSIPKPSRDALAQAVRGIDDAMVRVVEVTRQAIQRSRDRVRDYGEHDLAQALRDLRALDQMFMESFRHFVVSSGSLVKDLAQEVYDQFRAGGSRVSETVTQSIHMLQESDLRATGRDNLKRGFDMARDATAQIADIASGILSGVADALRPDSGARKPGATPPPTADSPAPDPPAADPAGPDMAPPQDR